MAYTTEDDYPDFELQLKNTCIKVKDTYTKDRRKEIINKLPKNFLDSCQFTPSEREMAVNWILEQTITSSVFTPQVLQLSIAIFDRYVFKRGKCHSVICSVAICYVLASKLDDDIKSVTIKRCAELLFHKYPIEKLLRKEREILRILDYNLYIPLPCNFLERCNLLLEYERKREMISFFLVEIAVVSPEMCHMQPSLLAAAACCLSLAITKKNTDFCSIWDKKMIDHTKYTIFDLKPFLIDYIRLVITIIEEPQKFLVYEKYAALAFDAISLCNKLSGFFFRQAFLAVYQI